MKTNFKKFLALLLSVIVCFSCMAVLTGITGSAEEIEAEPVYDASINTLYNISSISNGAYTDGVYSVPAEKSAYFTTVLAKNASYYMTMVVKTNDQVNVSYRDSNGYFNIQKTCYNSFGTEESGIFVEKEFPKLTSGIRVTFYSTPTNVKIWVDGEKIVDDTYASGKAVNTMPGLSWTFADEVSISDVAIWTDETPDAEPVFDAQTQIKYNVVGATGGTYENGTLTIAGGTAANAFFKFDAPVNADYYATMVVKSTGTSNGSVNIGFRGAPYYNMNYTGGYMPNYTAWVNRDYSTLKKGARVTIYSSSTCTKIWVEGQKVAEKTYDTALADAAKLGISWSNGNEVVVSDISVWTANTVNEPQFNEAAHKRYDLNVTSADVTYENGVMTVPSAKTGVFGCDLTSNAEYYMSMTVKTAGSVNIVYTTGNGYFNMNKSGHQSVGTDGSWVNKSFAALSDGIKVTVHFVPGGNAKIWVGGELVIDALYTKTGVNYPSIYSLNQTTTISNINVWTDKSNEEPVFDANENKKYDLNVTSADVIYSDGTLSIPGGKTALFGCEFAGYTEYYMSMTVKTAGNVNIVYTTNNGYFNMNKNGYQSVGTSGSWVNKSFAALATGIKVSVHYIPNSTVKVWVGGELVVNAPYTKAGVVYPSIYAFNDVTVNDIVVWTEENVYESNKDSVYVPTSYGENGTEENGVITVTEGADASAYFATNLKSDAEYYMSMTVKNPETAAVVGFSYRDGARVQFEQHGFYVINGTNKWYNWADIGNGVVLANGVDVTVECKKDTVSVWINGCKIVNELIYAESIGTVRPGISCNNKGVTEVTNLKIWTENTLGDIVVDHNSEGINSRDLAYLKKHLIDSQNYAVQAEDADVNADGNVDILDFIRFKKKMVNLADFG